jgi:ABC-type multidrug transport system ATPase subunit
MNEAHDILDTRGGGSCDIVSLALRFVLLEIAKMPGFIFFDECEKHLDSPETLQKMIEFVQEMQKETKRQIFWITHKQEVVDSVINPIIISKNNQKIISNEIKKSKKKRGRPKKNVKEN